ncbi:pseudo histidine-containing phosphotransfer protein 2-like isoform X2 [Typha angustifolia]|uniref:pseudo histidine-containing phosphotransfer protein 2-like isoform X2 n=1 Tax=Typha angustifolia TaxID=59011 RepID=UPI003C2D5858
MGKYSSWDFKKRDHDAKVNMNGDASVQVDKRRGRICEHADICKGYLDDQFNQIEELQDEVSPNFVEEVVALFFKDSSRLLANIERVLEKYPRDFSRLDSLMYQLIGSVSSIGALRMKNECTSFRDHCSDGNLEGCKRSFQKVKREYTTLKQKLEKYFQWLRQAGPVEQATNSRK